MKRKKLANIQWRFIRFSVTVSVVVALTVIVITALYFQIDLQVLYLANWFNVPLIAWILLLVITIGIVSGYLFGNLLKKRLEVLVQSILTYERGNYAHRVPPLGDDEIGLVAEHLNEMAQRIEKQVASLQRLSTEKVEWQEQLKKSVISEERQRLSRELHDAVSQQLFAISMMSSAVQENIGPTQHKIKSQIVMIEKMACSAQNEMRALLLHLRPATLEGKGLKEGLDELLTEFRDKQEIDIQWNVVDIPDLPKGIEDHVFRIVQEGLSNVLRHSKATSVTVRLSVRKQQLNLTIFDNGIGFDMNKSKKSSYGLQLIQERVNEIGGVAEVMSFLGKGTQVDVKVPIIDVERER